MRWGNPEGDSGFPVVVGAGWTGMWPVWGLWLDSRATGRGVRTQTSKRLAAAGSSTETDHWLTFVLESFWNCYSNRTLAWWQEIPTESGLGWTVSSLEAKWELKSEGPAGELSDNPEWLQKEKVSFKHQPGTESKETEWKYQLSKNLLFLFSLFILEANLGGTSHP